MDDICRKIREQIPELIEAGLSAEKAVPEINAIARTMTKSITMVCFLCFMFFLPSIRLLSTENPRQVLKASSFLLVTPATKSSIKADELSLACHYLHSGSDLVSAQLEN